MKILDSPITIPELKEFGQSIFGDMVKAVVDVEQNIIALYADLHSDLEALLIEEGSKQENLWGINLYPDAEADDFIEFDSMINLRPLQGNRSRGVDSADMRKAIIEVVDKWITR
ncbi:MAG: hypothetical protein GX568_00525 [Candidatus Gastranaerophilales bacterium]|nr:hypothetical protein [Candidatus Gastranaerophilales bacterium]